MTRSAALKAKRRRRWKGERHVRLHFWLVDSQAYRSLSSTARALLVEIMRLYHGENNGRLALSVRDAGRLLRVSKNTAARAFDELIDRKFIEVVTPSAFTRKDKRATEYALTEFRNDVTGAIPSRAFMRWQPQIQKAVPLQ